MYFTAHSDIKVAHEGGEHCPICGCPIERYVVQNRGTYFCRSASLQAMASDIEVSSGWIWTSEQKLITASLGS